MKKTTTLLVFTLLWAIAKSYASIVSEPAAKNVAINFYKSITNKASVECSITFTAYNSNNQAYYYVFSFNQNDGFVIVSAEDKARPIIGYSTKKQFVVPAIGTGIKYWLDMRCNQIDKIREINYKDDKMASILWKKYSKSGKDIHQTRSTMSVAPLVQTIWDQEPYYNDSCPNASLTGCVATAMAQIMKFWNFPTTGSGSSSYCDCTVGGFANNFGILKAFYGNTTYDWANMPLSVTGPNSAVAQLMYHCGVSVEMDYDTAGSGAQVIIADDPSACSQISYVNYFRYDPNTIQGLIKDNFTDNDWIALLKNDLDLGRPIQYAGDDTINGGHTWVCDGYDNNDMFHMNWGWSGSDDGYFDLSNLDIGGYNPGVYQEALIGIQPAILYPNDAGISSLTSTQTLACVDNFTFDYTLKNFGTDTLFSCNLNYQIDNDSIVSTIWNGILEPGAIASNTLSVSNLTDGSHTINCFTTLPNDSLDNNSYNDLHTFNFTISLTGDLPPITEGFEASSNIPDKWSVINDNNDASWMINSNISNGGINSIAFNNCDGNGMSNSDGLRDRFITPRYDFSSASSVSLKFDLSYAMSDYDGEIFSDTLVVLYSTDCGITWNEVYNHSGTALATAPTFVYNGSCWEGPSDSTQWQTQSIDLNSLAGQASVFFAFENRSNWSSWLFIDNINISNTSITGINNSNLKENAIKIYPNPASSFVNIDVFNTHNGFISYSLFDITGKEVKNNKLQTNGSFFNFKIDIENLTKGIYLLKVSDGVSSVSTSRIIKD